MRRDTKNKNIDWADSKTPVLAIVFLNILYWTLQYMEAHLGFSEQAKSWLDVMGVITVLIMMALSAYILWKFVKNNKVD